MLTSKELVIAPLLLYVELLWSSNRYVDFLHYVLTTRFKMTVKLANFYGKNIKHWPIKSFSQRFY